MLSQWAGLKEVLCAWSHVVWIARVAIRRCYLSSTPKAKGITYLTIQVSLKTSGREPEFRKWVLRILHWRSIAPFCRTTFPRIHWGEKNDCQSWLWLRVFRFTQCLRGLCSCRDNNQFWLIFPGITKFLLPANQLGWLIPSPTQEFDLQVNMNDFCKAVSRR